MPWIAPQLAQIPVRIPPSAGLVWALGEQEPGSVDAVPRQYAFDEVLEQHVGQAEVFDIVGMQPVQAALNGKVGCVLFFGASGAGKAYTAATTTTTSITVTAVILDATTILPSCCC